MSPNEPTSGWLDPNPPDTTGPRTDRVLTLAGVGLTALVLVVLVGVVLAKQGGLFGEDVNRPSVLLIAANATSDDSFMPSVVVSPIEIPDTVASDLATFTAQLPVSSARGARLVPGTQRGLYGSTGDTPVCDVPAVANYLDANPERSAPWAEEIGIAPQKIPYYLNTLTPVALITDTWVTVAVFIDGRAVPTQAVMQAGSAVLIDQVGVPRVHCATGNPLTPPANVNLSALEISGKEWTDFSLQNIIAVAYSGGGSASPIVTEFDLRDVSSGEVIARPTGGTIAIGPDPTGWAPDPAAMNVPPIKGMN